MARALPEVDPFSFLPYKYEDRIQPRSPAEFETDVLTFAEGVVESVTEKKTSAGKMLIVVLTYHGHTYYAKYFSYTEKYHMFHFKQGAKVWLWGKPKKENGKWAFYYPEIVRPEERGMVLPIYETPKFTGALRLRNYVQECARKLADVIEDEVPEFILHERGLPSIKSAILRIHCPDGEFPSHEHFLRMAYHEIAKVKFRIVDYPRRTAPAMSADIQEYKKMLPEGFKWTDGQTRAIGAVAADMSSSRAMRRLCVGDVGCGKTEVAMAACYLSYKSGYRTIVLAPTTVLASQMHEKFSERFGKENVSFCTAKSKPDENAPIIVGTHALLNIKFSDVGLVVLDEEHRLGVAQKQRMLGDYHALEMSATPIPRTISLMLHGAIDVSEIHDRPFARSVKTMVKERSHTKEILSHLRTMIESGQKAIVIYPLVEETPDSKYKSIESAVGDWEKLYPGKFVWVHGKVENKQQIVDDFRLSNDKQLLVATSLVESGVDIPEASMLIVSGAEKFGLSQLHQLRGRIGRRGNQSFCYLICTNDTSRARLAILEQVSDGFLLADMDADLRGWGTLFADEQSGHSFNLPWVGIYREAIQMVAEDFDKYREELHLSGGV